MSKVKPKTRVDSSVTDETIYHYFASLDCPRSLTAWILYKSGEHDQLAELVCKPEDHCNTFSFRSAYRATQFLRKATFLKVKVNPKLAALEAFEVSELVCKETNRRWKDRRFENADWNMIHRVSRKILSILGCSPNYERWVDDSSWGPGASLSVKRRDSSSYKKFRDERGITVDASDLIPYIEKFYPLLGNRTYQYELGDRVVVVPKDATKDRVILIQPGWNLWFQKGLGKQIRSKLRLSGLDLSKEAPFRNQFLAKVSSFTGHLATVDMKSASDRLAIEPLREVLPPDWFRLLDFLRCKRSCDGRTWEKFSSMGNGFTFELESLVFYALAFTCCERLGLDTDEVSVFGDDIIIPVGAVSSFRQVCSLFGFKVNDDKSFSVGSFRESCGEHYFDGVDCKPIFLKQKITDVVAVYKIHNSIRRMSHDPLVGYCDSSFRRICSILRKAVDKYYRLLIPDGFGEVGFISNFDEATPSRARDHLQGFFFRGLIDIPVTFESDGPSLLLVRLTEHSDKSRLNAVEIKSRTRRIFKKLLAFEWYDLGPWL